MNCKTLQLSSSVMSLGYKSKWDSSSFYCNHNILSMCSLFLFQTPISPGVNSNFCFKSYKYEYGEILMIWTQANCAGINRVCLRQNCEHTRGRVVFLFFRTDHMICSAQCRAERGVDLLQIRNSAVKSWGISQPSSGLRALWSPYSKSPKCRVARPRGSLLTTRVAPCPGNFHLSKIIFHSFSLKVFFPLGKLADGAFYSFELTRKLLLLTPDWRWYFSRDKSWELGGGGSLFCPFPQNLRLTPRVLYDVFGASSG